MAPPAKRQKRLIALSSEDEEETAPPRLNSKAINPKRSKPNSQPPSSNGTTTRSLPTRSRAKTSKIEIKSQGSSATLDSITPPKRPTSKTKAAEKSQVSRPISTFFGQANHTQQPNHQPKSQVLKEQTPEVEDEEEDLIEDESPVEDIVEIRGLQDTTRSVLDRRKRPLLPTQQAHATKQPERPSSGSQRFKIAGSGSGGSTGSRAPARVSLGEKELRPWAEEYRPANLEELAVHNRKVSDVRNWLENVLQGRDRKRILILKGPSGAGKTTTVSILAKAMEFELSEWKNPVGSDFSSEIYSSMSAQFGDFLGRSGRFSTLSFTHSTGSDSITPSPTAATKVGSIGRKVILLEEFPSTFLSSSSALCSFRSSILEYLAANAPPMVSFFSRSSDSSLNVTPIVIVITETRLTSSSAASDNFTAHRLLGSDILSHPGVSTIEFNPMASTLVTKALDLVMQKEARHSGRRRIPGPSVLKQLGEVGDVRSAIGSLEFLCLRAEDGDDWGGRVASRAKKGASESALTKMERESLELVTQRESSLGLFHAVGKVVYNKRVEVPSGESAIVPLQQPPDHLSEHFRLRVPQTSVDHLIDETGTDTSTFVAALHENYVLSCEGATFTDSLNGCMEALSDSDLLSSPRGGRFGSSGDYGGRSFQGAAANALRQDEICFQVAVRGLLFGLPNPVKRKTHPTVGKAAGKNDTYKMYYPISMRLWRQMEEVDGLVDRWTDRLRAGTAPSGQMGSTLARQFVGKHPKGQRPAATEHEPDPQSRGDADAEPIRTSLNCTKNELVLERLPYITKIEKRSPAAVHVSELEKITQFHGINAPNDEASDDESLDEAAPATQLTALQHAGQAGKEAATLVLPVEEDVGHLYLSDDDIED